MTLVPESVIPGLEDEMKVVFTSEGTTATPFKVSLESTFVKAVPPVNAIEAEATSS